MRRDILRFNKDHVEDWLKENDPNYGENKDYWNNDRYRWVRRKEIPFPPHKVETINYRRCLS